MIELKLEVEIGSADQKELDEELEELKLNNSCAQILKSILEN